MRLNIDRRRTSIGTVQNQCQYLSFPWLGQIFAVKKTVRAHWKCPWNGTKGVKVHAGAHASWATLIPVPFQAIRGWNDYRTVRAQMAATEAAETHVLGVLGSGNGTLATPVDLLRSLPPYQGVIERSTGCKCMWSSALANRRMRSVSAWWTCCVVCPVPHDGRTCSRIRGTDA